MHEIPLKIAKISPWKLLRLLHCHTLLNWSFRLDEVWPNFLLLQLSTIARLKLINRRCRPIVKRWFYLFSLVNQKKSWKRGRINSGLFWRSLHMRSCYTEVCLLVSSSWRALVARYAHFSYMFVVWKINQFHSRCQNVCFISRQTSDDGDNALYDSFASSRGFISTAVWYAAREAVQADAGKQAAPGLTLQFRSQGLTVSCSVQKSTKS